MSEVVYNSEKLRELFWQNDIEHGSYIKSQYDEIKRVIGYADKEWVMKQYEKIKLHAIAQTDFYKNYNINDIFPVVNKNIIINNYDSFIAKSGYTRPTHISSTSGSTGTPFSVIQDFKKRKRTIADLKVFGEMSDYPSHERMIFFRVISEKLKRTPEQENRENIYYIDSSDLGVKSLEKMCMSVIEKQPHTLMSYSSTLVEIAEYIISAGIEAEKFGVSSIITIGEGLSEDNHKLLENAFDCKVYRRYSDMEMGIMGQDRGDNGSYILNWGSYYFECLKLDSDEPSESGEVGRIVVTDLFNYAFPMIRYDTGDLGIMENPVNDGFSELKEIYGRARDCVYTADGRMLSPAKISVSMWGEKSIKQWQFIQSEQKKYILKLNADKSAYIGNI
ncbi:MAG: hypothetical protein K2O36_00580, partial [Ruminococcus sp.]|nr:hypothetical protein [Ruminococcus sp.]